MENTSLLLEISRLQNILSDIHSSFIRLANSNGITAEDRAIYIEMLMWANTTESALRNTATTLWLKPDSKIESELADFVALLREQIMETTLKLEQ